MSVGSGKPNILYIHSHDTGRYVQPYGHAVPTPSLQQFAEQGVVFRQAFCGNPTCSPSRACLVTGQHAHSNGMLGLAHRGFSMEDYTRHLLHTLRKAGYHSVLSGFQHIAHGPNAETDIIGYDQFLGNAKNAEKSAVSFLEQSSAQPFFLSVGFSETHRVFPEPGPTENPDHCIPPLPLPDTPETRHDMACYKASARILDHKMGSVFDALERTGLAKNTLVICTTDHGIAFPRMKCNLTDSGIGVMLMMRGPGGFAGGKVFDSLVSHIDLFPTVCDVLGLDEPSWLQGTSLVPLVKGEKEEVRNEIHAEVNYHAAYEPMRCVRTKQYKYVKRYDGRQKPVLCNCDESLSKNAWLKAGWGEKAPLPEALYDVILDPGETNNLVGYHEYESVLKDMASRLQGWMEETNDPLLKGDVPCPAGARVNHPDDPSPQSKLLPAGVTK